MEESPTRAAETLTRKWALFWGWATAGLFILFLVRAIDSSRDDFLAYYGAGMRALHGASPYIVEETPYRYLPLTSFFFVPFTLFSVSVARILFFILNFAGVVAIYSAIRRRVGDRATLLLLILFFRFHNHDFGNSQINPVLLILFFYWWKEREKNLAASSLAFSIFGSFKILPFMIGLPLLLRGRWREISWIGLWTVVLNFLPIFFYTRGPLVFADWYAQAKNIHDPVMLSNVQSIQAALWWMLDGKMPMEAFQIGMRIIQAALLLTVLALAPRRNREAWMIASTLAISAFIAPLAWKHNYLQLLPLAYLWFSEDPGFTEKRTRILYGLSFVGMVALPAAIGKWNTGFADRLYLMPYTAVIVVLLGVILAREAESRAKPARL